ncbi:MAG: hypothetical protein AB1705_21565, partial [Verrucomicrobiota bacterium]
MLKELGPITARLAAADRRVQTEKGGSLLLRAVPWFFLCILLAFALDAFLHLDGFSRLLLMGVWFLGGLILLGVSAYVAFVRRNSHEHVARLLEDREPSLGSKLINLLQLHAQAEDASKAPMTRQLAQMAVADYSQELDCVDLDRVARTDRLRRDLKRGAWFALGFAGVLGLFYNVTLAELPRFADPFGDHPPFSFTRLEIVEPSTNNAVVYKQSAGIKVKHAGHRPDELFLTFHPPNEPHKAVTVPMFDKGRDGFFQQIENIQTDLMVVAHTKNRHSLSKARLITVLLTPKMDKAFVQVAPPEYTGLKPEEKPFQFKSVRALIGSQVRFRLQSNRPLREGTVELLKPGAEPQRIALAKSGENEVTGVLEARETGRLRFSFVDVDGISSEELWEGSLTVTHDLSPEIQIVNPNKDGFVAIDYPLEVQVEANDDYGVKQVRLHRAVNKEFLPVETVAYDKITRHAREVRFVDFKQMGLKPGDLLTLFAEVIDTAPEPNLARSQTINLAIISVEEYNEFLREQTDLGDIEAKYADLLDKFHEQIEEQRKLGKDIDALREKLAKADAARKEALQQELDKLLARQNELNQKLNKLADQMENFVRKDPLYDVEAELQGLLAEKAQQIRDSTKQTDSRTQDIAQQSSPPSGQRQLTPGMLSSFKRASDEQIERLAAAEKQAREDVVEPLHELAQLHDVVKNFNRFQELFEAQQMIAAQTAAYNRAGP